MTCEHAQALLMERETVAIAALLDGAGAPDDGALAGHIAGCERCATFARQLLQMDEAVADHVESFAERGDFARDWAIARKRVDAIRRRPVHRTFFAIAALAAMLTLATRIALSPVLPIGLPRRPPEPPEILSPAPAPAPPEAMPAPEEPMAVAPAPAPAPPLPSPRPLPARAPAPRPVASAPARIPAEPPMPSPPEATPAPEEPVVAPAPAPQPPMPSTSRRVTFEIDAAVEAAHATLRCGSVQLTSARKGRVLQFEAVPAVPCVLEIDGTSLTGVVAGLDAYRVVRFEGSLALMAR